MINRTEKAKAFRESPIFDLMFDELKKGFVDHLVKTPTANTDEVVKATVFIQQLEALRQICESWIAVGLATAQLNKAVAEKTKRNIKFWK